MSLPTTYKTEDVAAMLQVTVQTVRDLVKKPGAPKPVRLSDSPTAPMRWTEQDVADLLTFMRPTPVPAPRRRRRAS